MSADLHRLVYYSRNRSGAAAGALSNVIDDILATSRRNNEKAGVTGALMFNSGCFAQVLEGPREALEATFERIQQDERHGEVSLLAFEPIDRRTFETWSMGFVGRALDGRRFEDVAASTGYDPSRMDGEELFQTLETFAIEEEANAA
jgi:hypothetical protein